MILMTCSNLMYFTSLYNASELPGNPLLMVMVFAIAESSGMLISSGVIKFISIPKAIGIFLFIMIILNFIIKFFDISEETVLILFLFEAFILGSFFNLIVLIQSSLIVPQYQAMSFEINYSIGYASTIMCPFIAKLAEPYPTIFLTSMGVLVLMVIPMLIKITAEKEKQMDQNESI
jgi:hypothetical protein